MRSILIGPIHTAAGYRCPMQADTAAPTDWLAAAEAAAHLGVSRATLYSYVSRGLLVAHAAPTGARGSRYRRDDVERLARRQAQGHQPRLAAQGTLDWGLPVLASALTLVQGGRLFYRGQDALQLATSATLEDAAALLWAAPVARGATAPLHRVPAHWMRPLQQVALPQRLLARLAWLQARLHADAAPVQHLRCMAQAVMGEGAPESAPRVDVAAPLHRQLQQAWRLTDRQADVVRQVLVLCADHELNASSFTVRCVASTGAGLGACLQAGLAALSGPRHGGMTAEVQALWPQWAVPRQPPAEVRKRLRAWMASRRPASPAASSRGALHPAEPAGAAVPGFGHPLYPQGDPRAAALLALLRPSHRGSRWSQAVADLTGLMPTLDFALVAVQRSLRLPADAAFLLFALGRTVGWLAHALEQQAEGTLIRPRAAYVGESPAVTAPSRPPNSRVVRCR